YGYVGTKLAFSALASDPIGLSGRPESAPDKSNTDRRYAEAYKAQNYGYDDEPGGAFRHALLGGQVVLGSLGFAASFGLIYHALKSGVWGRRKQRETWFVAFAIGIVGALFCGIVGVSGLLGVVVCCPPT